MHRVRGPGMAIGNGWLRKTIVTLALWLGRCWLRTVRIHIEIADPSLDSRQRLAGCIYCIWHEDIIAGAMAFGEYNLKVLVSQSQDGEYIARTIERLGFTTIRGSWQRGGAQALREAIRAVRANCLAITPDGPKGPRRAIKDGLTYLASRSGAPVVAVGYAYSRAYRFGSWDRLAIAWPWTRVVVYVMPGLEVPRSAGKEEFEQYSQQLQARMADANARAEQLLAQWQRSGQLPVVLNPS